MDIWASSSYNQCHRVVHEVDTQSTGGHDSQMQHCQVFGETCMNTIS